MAKDKSTDQFRVRFMAKKNDKKEDRIKEFSKIILSDHETESTSNDTGRLRQGDIIEWTDKNVDEFRVHAIIVTADCDIAQNKTRGILTYAPIFSMQKYLGNFFIPDQLEKARSKLFGVLRERLHSMQGKYLPGLNQFSDMAIGSWVQRASAAEICSKFTEAGANELKNLDDAVRNYIRATKVDSLSSDQMADIIGQYASVIYPTSPSPEETLGKELSNHLQNLPGDVYFIHNISEELSGGYFIMLRYISQCPSNQIAVSAEGQNIGTTARRISRLRSPYVYSLTQALGRVFSDVGLPDRHEKILKTIVDATLAKDIS